MNVLIEFGKILLPAILVLYAMYITMKSILVKELEKKMLELKTESSKTVLPVRLQAYERLALFLERISPRNLILRLNSSGLTAREFQHVLLHEVREEYNHNLSQQIYLSEGLWDLISKTVDQIIAMINTSAENMEEKADGKDLAREVFNAISREKTDPVRPALSAIRAEISELF